MNLKLELDDFGLAKKILLLRSWKELNKHINLQLSLHHHIMFFADIVRKEVEDLTNDFKIQAQVTQKSPEEQEKQKKEDEKR